MNNQLLLLLLSFTRQQQPYLNHQIVVGIDISKHHPTTAFCGHITIYLRCFYIIRCYPIISISYRISHLQDTSNNRFLHNSHSYLTIHYYHLFRSLYHHNLHQKDSVSITIVKISSQHQHCYHHNLLLHLVHRHHSPTNTRICIITVDIQ